jgi:hypothetical protein
VAHARTRTSNKRLMLEQVGLVQSWWMPQIEGPSSADTEICASKQLAMDDRRRRQGVRNPRLHTVRSALLEVRAVCVAYFPASA